MTLEEISQIANDFRKFFDNAKSSKEFFRDGSIEYFPIGCCGIASNLLGRYLFEECHIRCWYNSGKFGIYTHTWLTLEDGTIIDITGDQFNFDFPSFNIQAVYVGPLDDFHSLFTLDKPKEFNEEEWEIDSLGVSRWSIKNIETYQMILDYLKH